MKTDKSSLVRKILLATLAAVMLFSTAAMAKTVTMKWDSSSKMYTKAYTMQNDGTLKFKLNVTQSGVLDVTGYQVSPYGSTLGVSITMRNANGTRLDYYSSNYVNASSSGSYARYAVTPGTYYFKIKASEGYKYRLGAAFATKCKNYGGSSKANSVNLPRNTVLTGVVSAYSFRQAKWFKFYVPSQGKQVKLKMQVNGGQGQTIVFVAGPNFSSTWHHYFYPVKDKSTGYTLTFGQRVYSGGSSYTTGPKAGTYYVLFTKEASSSYKRSSGQFAVKWYY